MDLYEALPGQHIVEGETVSLFSEVPLGFLLAAVVLLVFCWHSVQLTGQRNGECVLTQTSVAGAYHWHFPASALRGAQIQDSRDSKGHRTYRVALDTRTDLLPLSWYSTDLEQVQQEADAVNAFAQGKSPNLDVKEDGTLMLEAGLVCLGLAALIWPPLCVRFELQFAAGDDRVTYRRVTRLGGRRREFARGQIRDVRIEHLIKWRGKAWSRVRLVLEDGRKFTLSHYPTIDALERDVVKLRTLLGIGRSAQSV
ncbi:MAG TPA: hypothetical protein V6D47_03825 [Oscillatoriaceae cyanobacterium]